MHGDATGHCNSKRGVPTFRMLKHSTRLCSKFHVGGSILLFKPVRLIFKSVECGFTEIFFTLKSYISHHIPHKKRETNKSTRERERERKKANFTGAGQTLH